MANLAGLRVSLCQMPVTPGRPDLNAAYINKEIKSAASRRSDIIIFPEMATCGYALGDKFEDDRFIMDINRYNDQIRETTHDKETTDHHEIATIFGSVVGNPKKSGRDGRLRKYNAALIAQGGIWVGKTIKTLHPDYSVFDDDRHFYSMLNLMLEDLPLNKITEDTSSSPDLRDYLNVFPLQTNIGLVRVGVIICEDTWSKDYPFNPGKVLAEKGIDLLVIIMASPWTWQKRRKRHQIIKDLAVACRDAGCPVPIVAVGNTGIQNNVKNIIIFDGSAACYNQDGEILFEAEPYIEGTHDFVFSEDMVPLEPKKPNDSKELFNALKCAGSKHVDSLPPSIRKIVIGLSGGIDSSVAAAFWTHIVGPENVYGISMPGPYTSEETASLGSKLAQNLGIHFEVIPITDAADLIAQKTSIERGNDVYGNILSRLRREILSATAEKIGGVFTCNGNKVEIATGYTTRYGDNAGFLAIFGDLLKREVYQVGEYLNRVIYKQEVIPAECFTIKPTAELKKNQKDPFYYGNLVGYNYHDQLVRAWVEFRWDPEVVLEHYIRGSLESEFRLNPGHLDELFPTPHEFIKDLERCWRLYHLAVSKRGEGPPIPRVSRRSFGFDLRESMLSPYLTLRYHDLKVLALSKTIKQKRIVIFGGSFNPTSRHHIYIAQKLAQSFDLVIVVPCGSNRKDKSLSMVSDIQRKDIAKLAFDGVDKVRVDLFDLDSGTFTPTWKLQEIYQEQFPDAQIWHVVGGDIITGGRDSNSEIHKIWDKGNEIWGSLNFAVIARPGYRVEKQDMPPSSELIEIERIVGSATMIRERIANGKPIDDLVTPAVANYINKNHLYSSK